LRLLDEKIDHPVRAELLLILICSIMPSGVFWLWDVPMPMPGQT